MPVIIEGEELCDPVYVDRSVRKGCPLSGIFLKLVIDHLITAELTPVSSNLGYMGYLPLIVDKPGEAKCFVHGLGYKSTTPLKVQPDALRLQQRTLYRSQLNT